MFQKKRKREIQNCFLTIQKYLEIEPPFVEFNTPKPLNEKIFFDYLEPYIQEAIEDCFCAKVQNNGEQDFLVQFDTGECLELQLICRIRNSV